MLILLLLGHADQALLVLHLLLFQQQQLLGSLGTPAAVAVTVAAASVAAAVAVAAAAADAGAAASAAAAF